MGREHLDEYRLDGKRGERAVEGGLAGADWFRSAIPRPRLRELMGRSDRRALIDLVLWLGGLTGSGVLGVLSYGTWRAIPCFAVYGLLYGSGADARWHEYGHGTAFRTRWLNAFGYQLGSFMNMLEPTVWRWSHARHHTDTLVVGRDPEIDVMRPARLVRIIANFFGLVYVPMMLARVLYHATGRITSEEASFLPATELRKVFRTARVWLAIYAAMIAACIAFASPLPFLLVLGPRFYGAFLGQLFVLTQHSGLGEDFLDHRLNTRTVLMNPIFRFLYLNMNYHVEHHMFPLVPYHKLPALHAAVKHDLVPASPSLFAAYREIVPAVIRQLRDQTYYIHRELPLGAHPYRTPPVDSVRVFRVSASTWIAVCAVDDVEFEDVVPFDHAGGDYALYRAPDGSFYATEGHCTHERARLCDGLVMGSIIECPRHNGRFDYRTGEAKGAPAIIDLRTYRTRVDDGTVYVFID